MQRILRWSILFCRWILNVKKSTNLSALYGELGRVPFIIQRKFNMIKYWVKLLKSNDSFLPKKMYRILKDDADSGNSYNGSNWASCIKSLLDNSGLSYIWLQQGEIDIPLQLIKQRIFDHYYQHGILILIILTDSLPMRGLNMNFIVKTI